MFTTNRWVVRGNNDLIIGLILEIEDDPKNIEMVNVYKQIKINFCEAIKEKKIKIIAYPINFLSETKIKKFLRTNSSEVDAIIKLRVHSGSIDASTHQIQIKNFHIFVCNSPIINFQGDRSNIMKEITINNYHKQWKLLSTDYFNGKINIVNHFEDFLNHLIGILYISKGQYDKSLHFLEKLLNNYDFTTKSIVNRINEKDHTVVSKFRIIDLLCKLYIQTSDRHIYSNPEEALKILSKYEKLNLNTNYSPIFYTRMAKMHYECGNLDKAIFYTDKILETAPDFYTVYYNRVFFGILRRDWNMIYNNLKQIYHKKNRIDFEVGIIDFLDKEQKKSTDPSIANVIAVIINVYQALFTDTEQGKKLLKLNFNYIEINDQTKDLRRLINRIIDST
jgi:tetratricopeptide (TPR) repeat protein